ncbi:metalloregulator [Lactococcus fujiensis JCM 16395]|uniref:Manganese transport regulator n=2 Tax=Lactococcus fujiensis TaxID=610251 RepID=A0A2A5RNX2_9LACT|nr:metalloregulator [Lactococcus fujiensis JCM 16395]
MKKEQEMLELTKNEQDYLKAIYMLENKTSENFLPVQVNTLAKKLMVSSPSATEMIKRLAKKDYVDYLPYRGVNLSAEGRRQARFIIKSHRVWETFLVEKLSFLNEEVHAEAENLEHASSPKLVEQLYAFLDYPERDPHGSVIPPESFWSSQVNEISLNRAISGKNYYVSHIGLAAQTYFEKIETIPPHFIKVVEELEDHSIIVKSEETNCFLIPHFIGGDILLLERN